MIGRIFFVSWRLLQLVTLIPAMGMLAYFVNIYNSSNLLTPGSILTMFIVSVLAVAWCTFTLFRVGSVRRNALFVGLIELGFMGAFIASAYELRGVAGQQCVVVTGGGVTTSSGTDSVTISYNAPGIDVDKTCSMLKACFAFAIMNAIFFPVTAFIAWTMNRPEEYREEYTTRRSHGSRRGHSSHSGHRRSSSSRRQYYV